MASNLVSARRDDRYELRGEIARGGLARVTQALDRTLQRRVAIKQLHQHGEVERRRFMREALTTARLQHPAIVPVFDAGTWESGDPYLVLKLLDGNTLSAELVMRTTHEARLGLLPQIMTVADALAYAHEQGVVHRDVKPANIMIGTHGETVLLDWGLAYDTSGSTPESTSSPSNKLAPDPDGSPEPLTTAGSVPGTVRYMSPEQARGQPPTPAFDVYSLGATLARMLSGKQPFEGTPANEIGTLLRAGKTGIPALPVETPPDLAAIVAKATAPAAQRYANGGQLADDLRKFIAGQLVSARTYTTRQLVARWIRRHRVLLAISGFAVVAMAITGVIAVRSVVEQRNVAVEQRQRAVDRERELVLLQARAHLRDDPTASLAWLKGSEPDLALLDEAEGRGVARHVWRTHSPPVAAVFGDDALFVVDRDGHLMKAEIATGRTHELASIGVTPIGLRVVRDAAYVVDREGVVWKQTSGGVTRRAEVPVHSRLTGLYLAGSDLRVTFTDDDGVLISPDAHQLDLKAYDFFDDEHDSSAVYALTKAGALDVLDPQPRRICQLAPGGWVRSSSRGSAYLAVEPLPNSTVAIWMGTLNAGPPVKIDTPPACANGENRETLAEVGDDGRFALLVRCGELAAYDAVTRRPVDIGDPLHVAFIAIASDGHHAAIARGTTVELLDLATGASRTLETGAAVVSAELSSDGAWLATAGAESAVRLWSLADAPLVGRLGDRPAPARLVLTDRPDELSVRRHLDCAMFRTSTRALDASIEVRPEQSRNSDDESALWAWGASADGHTCVFSGSHTSVLVARIGQPVRALSSKHGLESCVISVDAKTLSCRTTDDWLVTLDGTTGAELTAQQAPGHVQGVVRFRARSMALVQRATDCALVGFTGETVAILPGGGDCAAPHASNATQPGRESAIIISRTGAVDVWTETGVLVVPAETGLVEVSLERGLVAVARDQSIEVRDLRSGDVRARPAGHARAISQLAWSSTGLLASADGETVRVWDPATSRTRVLYAPNVTAIVWAHDGALLYTTDGKLVRAWPIDVAKGADPAAMRARLEALTSTTIVGGRAQTVR